MTLMVLPMFSAIPFNYPSDDRSLAARRFRSSRLKKEFGRRDVQQQVEQHLIMTTVVEGAVEALQSCMVGDKYYQARLPNTPRPPPNSPNDSVVFTFDDPATPSTSSSAVASSPSSNITRASRGRRSLKKRRRVPSFKTKTDPRVPAKIAAIVSSEEEADDEASEEDDEHFMALKVMTATTTTTVTPTTSNFKQRLQEQQRYYASTDEEEELSLKLRVLSEVQKARGLRRHSTSCPPPPPTDWAKVGAELRQIADKFSSGDGGSSEGESADVPDGGSSIMSNSMHNDNNGNEMDFVTLINMMLPFSVPQSLWSALVSYAAWKIFKKFQ